RCARGGGGGGLRCCPKQGKDKAIASIKPAAAIHPGLDFPVTTVLPVSQFLDFLGATTVSRSGPRRHPAAPAGRPAHRNSRTDLRSCREPGDPPPRFPTEPVEYQEATDHHR